MFRKFVVPAAFIVTAALIDPRIILPAILALAILCAFASVIADRRGGLPR